MIITLLAHGCPRQAIVAVFGVDEQTVKSLDEDAGEAMAIAIESGHSNFGDS